MHSPSFQIKGLDNNNNGYGVISKYSGEKYTLLLLE